MTLDRWPMSTALADLVVALRSGDALLWHRQHAHDLDADAALRRAWGEETHAKTLLDVLDAVSRATKRQESALLAKARVVKRGGCVCIPFGTLGPSVNCAGCCAEIRAAVPCPTWSDLSDRVRR